jgi:hypothetical protein
VRAAAIAASNTFNPDWVECHGFHGAAQSYPSPSGTTVIVLPCLPAAATAAFLARPITSLVSNRTWRETHSDALVFFGATGDLAYKKTLRLCRGWSSAGI